MMTTPPSNPGATPVKQGSQQVSDRMAAFMAEELLPLMAGSWPASANQLDANARGVALAWGSVLSGLTPAQIREVVQDMASDEDRQFAPRPAEVRAEILRRMPAREQVAPTGQVISIRACEMMSEVKVRQRDGVLSGAALHVELNMMLEELRRRGVKITGRIS
ncbi:MAG: hypothetical protein ACRC8G_09035 [Plesiomonas shigelloides]